MHDPPAGWARQESSKLILAIAAKQSTRDHLVITDCCADFIGRFTGVTQSLTKHGHTWRARLRVKGGFVGLGHWETEEQAARAFDAAAIADGVRVQA